MYMRQMGGLRDRHAPSSLSVLAFCENGEFGYKCVFSFSQLNSIIVAALWQYKNVQILLRCVYESLRSSLCLSGVNGKFFKWKGSFFYC